jgi:type I restriction enzyme, R subunit
MSDRPTSFIFLESAYPELFKISELSEKLIHIDPSSSLAKSRLFSEKLAALLWEFEELEEFQGNQVDIINRLFYSNVIPEVVKDIFHQVRKSGNKATHDGNGTKAEAKFILKKIFQLSKWFYETYENDYVEAQYELPEVAQQKSVEELEEEQSLITRLRTIKKRSRHTMLMRMLLRNERKERRKMQIIYIRVRPKQESLLMNKFEKPAGNVIPIN